MRPIHFALLTVVALAASVVGCEGTAKAARFDADAVALEIVTAATFKSNTPAPVTPDEKVPRAECKDCKGTGTITHGDGHKTPCQNCYAAAKSGCTCGNDCNCPDCVGDCLGELITLADYRPAKESSLQLVAATNATLQQSGSCTSGTCGSNSSCNASSGGACSTGTSAASGSCASGACGSGEFMERGPVRRVINKARPVRRAAGFINRVRPVRRLLRGAGCLFGRCG